MNGPRTLLSASGKRADKSVRGPQGKMIPARIRLTKPPTSAEKIAKNINFGVAVGLTETAKQGQSAVVSALRGTFTLRGNWFQQSNKFGIKVKPAKKDDLSAEVRTQADWLEIHEKGGTKTARGNGSLAIPTENVRRNKRQIIPRAQRPAALRGKNTFVMKTSKGRVLFQRFKRAVGTYNGRPTKLKALYNLEPRARIRKQSTFFDPIDAVVKRRLRDNINDGLRKAFATMK